MPKPADKSAEIEVISLKTGQATYYVLGSTPLIFNRMSEKAKRELLMPRGRMTTAQKGQNLKHNPIEEYRNSVYRRRLNEPGPTRLQFKTTGFKGAMASAALDMPTSVAKTKMGRLTWVTGDRVDIWGIPRLFMDVVRSADMNKTPDIRTRARVEEWCSRVTFNFVEPMLSAQTVGTLLSAAGIIVGVGDYRQEKGKGSFGQFRLVAEDDPDLLRIMAAGGMAAQDAALIDPVCSDAESEELLTWFHEEYSRRGKDLMATPQKKARKRKNGAEEAEASL